MQNDYQTPMKSQLDGDGASTVARGLSNTKGMIESKIQMRENETQGKNSDQEALDQIEKEIHEIGRELENLYFDLQKETDKYSQNFLNMEHRRNQLRKRLIDLDYEHKTIFAKRIKEIRSIEQQEKEKEVVSQQERLKALRQQREQRDQQRKEQLQKYEQEYRQKLRASLNRFTSEEKKEQEKSESKQQQQSQQQPESNEEKNGQNRQSSAQDELSRSRRKLLDAKIEAELAGERLRRSRAEIDYLRYGYTDPYYLYRPYLLPPSLPVSYYYPYTSPLYSRLWPYY